jgi:hypothetical protein
MPATIKEVLNPYEAQSPGRPASEVFAFVSDQTNAPLWQEGLQEVRRITEGPIRVGTEHVFARVLKRDSERDEASLKRLLESRTASSRRESDE